MILVRAIENPLEHGLAGWASGQSIPDWLLGRVWVGSGSKGRCACWGCIIGRTARATLSRHLDLETVLPDRRGLRNNDRLAGFPGPKGVVDGRPLLMAVALVFVCVSVSVCACVCVCELVFVFWLADARQDRVLEAADEGAGQDLRVGLQGLSGVHDTTTWCRSCQWELQGRRSQPSDQFTAIQ